MVLLARKDPRALAGNSSEISLAFILTALGGGRKTDGETGWETEGRSREKETRVEGSRPGLRRGSGGSDGSATAQLHNHVLAVTAGAAVTHLL